MISCDLWRKSLLATGIVMIVLLVLVFFVNTSNPWLLLVIAAEMVLFYFIIRVAIKGLQRAEDLSRSTLVLLICTITVAASSVMVTSVIGLLRLL